MSENKTAEEMYLFHVGKAVNVRSVYYDRTINAIKEYATQQTSQLQKERDSLKDQLETLKSETLPQMYIAACDKRDELQEQADKLEGALEKIYQSDNLRDIAVMASNAFSTYKQSKGEWKE